MATSVSKAPQRGEIIEYAGKKITAKGMKSDIRNLLHMGE